MKSDTLILNRHIPAYAFQSSESIIIMNDKKQYTVVDLDGKMLCDAWYDDILVYGYDDYFAAKTDGNVVMISPKDCSYYHSR